MSSADSLKIYLTGAASNGGAQAVQTGALGNYRSSTEAERVSMFFASPIQGLTIDFASRQNGTDGAVGSVIAPTVDTLCYRAPNSAVQGPETAVSVSSQAVFVDGADPSKFIRATRTADMKGLGRIEYADQLNNVFGMSDAANSESTSGGNRYRAVMLKNTSGNSLTAVTAWIDPLGPSAVSSGAQLGGSGAGTITGASNCFIGWPYRGWCRVQQSGGTLREIVYYSSRTDNDLTVPSLGRGRLGTSAGAGAGTDVCYPVPGIRIAYEAASGPTGFIQTIASESTAPTGVTWSTAITQATGVAIGTLATTEQGALWIHRELPAGISASAKVVNRIKVQFTESGNSYTETLCGMFRIAVDARERYELYVGVGAVPDITGTPDETFTSLPHTTTLTLGAGTTNYLVTLKRNKYDLRSESLGTTIIRTNGAGAQILPPPSAPSYITVNPGLAGTFVVKGVYFKPTDSTLNGSSPADKFLIYAKYDGSTPDPALDTPTVVSLVHDGGFAPLNWTSPAQTDGATGKFIIRSRRSGSPNSDSTNSEVYTATASTSGPSAPSGRTISRAVAEHD